MTMTKPLSSSAQKVQQALAGFGLDCRVKELGESTRTAVEAALAVGLMELEGHRSPNVRAGAGPAVSTR